MNKKLIHTPEGVRDIYGDEMKKKRLVMKEIKETMQLYHYDEISTPVIEYFDVFNGEKGTAASNEMYKCFDRENNTLVLRPDMTPSIARCVAKYFSSEKHHIRLCYEGETFKNLSRLQGKLNETTQIGAELIGDDTSAADGEMISLVIDCLLATGLKEFKVSIGQVDYYRGLVEEAGLTEETADELRIAISNKNTFAIENICKEAAMSKELAQAFAGLTNTYGDLDVLEKAKQAVSNERSLKAIDRLEKLYHIVEYYDFDSYVSFDLGMLADYNYYSGIIFRGYTYGSGSPIVSGGRYNGLVKQFGVDTPSVGFAFLVDELLQALIHQKVELDTERKACMIVYEAEYQMQATKLAKQLRSQKQVTQLTRKSSRSTLDEYIEHCKKHGMQKMICMFESETDAKVITVSNQSEQTVAVDKIMGGAL